MSGAIDSEGTNPTPSTRRNFFKDVSLLAVGAAAGALFSRLKIPTEKKADRVFAKRMSEQNLMEKMGYRVDDRLLIVHSDDFGMTDSTNTGTIRAMKRGVVTSASLIMGCKKTTDEAIEFAKNNPNRGIGIEMAFTSGWGPISPRDKVPSLLDRYGNFPDTSQEFNARAKIEEVEIEARAQIEAAIDQGFQPSHLISHMEALKMRPEFQALFLRLAIDYMLPARYNELEWEQPWPVNKGQIGDHYYNADSIDERENKLFDDLQELKHGIWEAYGHCADSQELRANMGNNRSDFPDDHSWGWRLRVHDADFFCSDRLRKEIEKNRIQLISWRDIRNAITG